MQTTLRVTLLTITPSMHMTHQRIVVTLWATVHMLPVVLFVLGCTELKHLNNLLHCVGGQQAPPRFGTIELHAKPRHSFSTS